MKLLKTSLEINHISSFDALLLCVWTLPVLMYNLRGMVSRMIGSVGEEFFLPIIFSFCILLSINYIFKQIKFVDIFFFFLCVGYYFFCYNYYTMNKAILQEIEDIFLFQTIPVFFVGLCINIAQKERMLFFLSILCIFLKALSIFLGGGIVQGGTAGEETESMSAAHNILPYVLMILWMTFKNGSWGNWLLSAISVLFVLSLGNRGALFGIILFTVVYFILFKEYKRPFMSRLFIVTLGGVTYMFLKPVMFVFMSLFASMGLSTRIFAKFIEDNIADDNGRDMIYEYMKDCIEQGPFWGYGLAGDRAISGGLSDWSHNIFIEMQMTFGKIPGTFIIVALFFLLIIAFMKNRHKESSQFLLLLVSACSILLFSSSFIQYPMFFMMIGYAVNISRKIIIKKYCYDNIS